MAKFRFELEPLLKSRLHDEQRAQRAVAAIEAERAQREQALRDKQQQIVEHRRSLQDGLIGAVQVQQLRYCAAASLQGMREANRLALELAGIHRRLDAARLLLTEAARQRRIVERLKEQRLEQWRYAQNKAETDAMDELAIIAAARQRDANVKVALNSQIVPT